MGIPSLYHVIAGCGDPVTSQRKSKSSNEFILDSGPNTRTFNGSAMKIDV